MIDEFLDQPGLLPLEGIVQHYDWGGLDYIPGLLGRANPGQEPFAELWMGDHPSAPARVVHRHGSIALDQLIQEAPNLVLGPRVVAAYGRRLPYLFKVLDARHMLSIQAHPNLAQAQEGFHRENAMGIPIDSPRRNYKDDNHKPEAHVALTDFWMLHGFRPIEQILNAFDDVPELRNGLHDLKDAFCFEANQKRNDNKVIRQLYQRIMAMPDSRMNPVLDPLAARLKGISTQDKNTPEYWLARAAARFARSDHGFDRGLLAFYLLNLVHLKPGQSTYQPAGMLHAYLEGVNIELMANSDNVLRGGLTNKHIDLDELTRILDFNGEPAAISDGDRISDIETVYHTTAAEFELSRLCLQPGDVYSVRPQHGPQILVVVLGETPVRSQQTKLKTGRGSIILAPHVTGYSIGPAETHTVIYRAGVPAMS